MIPMTVRYALGLPVLAIKRRSLVRFRAALREVEAAQKQRLAAVLATTAGSAFAKAHGLASVETPADFAAALPVAGYERMAPYIERVMAGEVGALFRAGTDVLMFATTSGTTSAVKYIPVTKASVEEYRESWTVWGVGIADVHPRLPFAGVLNIASPWKATRAPSGVPCGSITGLLQQMMHRMLWVTNAVPPPVAEVLDSDARQYLALRLAMARPDVMMLNAANPSTLLSLASRMGRDAEVLLADIHDGGLRRAGDYTADVRRRLRHLLRPAPRRARALTARAAAAGRLTPRVPWPELELLAVWMGGTLSSYLKQLPAVFGEVALRDHGLSASEGRLTIPLADAQAYGPLNIHGAYCEFIPEAEHGGSAPRTLGAHQLEAGERYVIVLSTTGGLMRYDLGDVVECVGHLAAAPQLRFLNRGRDVANITGEKLSAFQVAEALSRTQKELDVFLGECALAPHFSALPGYHLLIEQDAFPSPEAAGRLAAALDRQLQELNMEYAEKRRTHRLAAVVATPTQPGTFAALRAARLAAAGKTATAEQYKHAFLVTDHEFVARVALPQAFTRSTS